MIAETSLEAYEGVKPKINNRQKIVLDVIEMNGAITNEGISEALGWPINQVTPRVNELRYAGLVGEEGRGMNRTGYSAKLWSVRDPNDKNLEKAANDCEA
jgi:predicted HTH transcriptional regulator